MKKYFAVLLLFVAACGQQHKNQATSAYPSHDELCYRTISNKDTSLLYLNVTSDTIVGTYAWLPFEKDAKKGTFKATRKGDLVVGKYAYTQEGNNLEEPIEIEVTDKYAIVSITSAEGVFKDTMSVNMCQ